LTLNYAEESAKMKCGLLVRVQLLHPLLQSLAL